MLGGFTFCAPAFFISLPDVQLTYNFLQASTNYIYTPKCWQQTKSRMMAHFIQIIIHNSKLLNN